MAAATLGGTVSVIGGGKFANGAIASAWVSMFNDQGRRRSTDDEYYSHDKTKTLATRMDIVAEEDLLILH